MRVGVIGIGSNSIRMLLSDVENGAIRQVLRSREGTRLFAGMEQNNGNMAEENILSSLDAISAFRAKALSMGVEDMHLFATSAVRDSANGADFAQRVLDATGLELEICPGEREAALSFLGATSGERAGVLDIGGGSTEYVIGEGSRIDAAFSLKMGAVRLYDRCPIRNREDARHVVHIAKDILAPCLPKLLHAGLPDSWYGTGGTLTTMGAIVRGIYWDDKTYLHGAIITRDDVENTLDYLSRLTVEERRAIPAISVKRADIIVHGIAILAASMEALSIETMTVSEKGNMDGYIKEKYLK